MDINNEGEVDKDNKQRWTYLGRQLLVCSGVWNCYFMLGLNLGTPTVLIPQLKAANLTVSDEMVSWITSAPSYSGIPWIFILSALATAVGRKKTYIITSVSCLSGFTVLFFSKTVNQILISNIIQGVNAAAFLTTSVIILTEYISSENRGLFLTLKSATFFWGILTANAIGTFFCWTNIALVGITCAAYNISTVFFWPESPYWLVSKGKFTECSESHVWLKGSGIESKKELENLTKTYEKMRFIKQSSFRSTLKTLLSKTSLKVVYLTSLLVCLYAFSGKLIYTVYALDILKKFTSDRWTAYTGMLVLDGVTVASMYLGCGLAKILKRRTMLILFSSISILFVFLLSLYLYLVKISAITDNIYVAVALLTIYSISASCGPMIMATSIIGELLPVKSRCVFMCLIALVFKLVFSTFLKISPYMFKHLKMHGTFLLYGVLSICTLILIYIYMPETHNKTLQEIEDTLNNKKSRTDEAGELMTVPK